MLIPSKFNGYFAGRRTCYEGGGAGGGGDGGPGGQSAGGNSPAGAEGMDGIGISGVNDGGFSGSGGDGSYGHGYGSLFEPKRPEALPYTAQALPTANTAIYKPTYSDYAAPSFDAVSNYGQNFQPYFSQGIGGLDYGRMFGNMFGNMPSFQGGYQIPYAMNNSNGGIADLYFNPPYFSNYGIAGLYR